MSPWLRCNAVPSPGLLRLVLVFGTELPYKMFVVGNSSSLKAPRVCVCVCMRASVCCDTEGLIGLDQGGWPFLLTTSEDHSKSSRCVRGKEKLTQSEWNAFGFSFSMKEKVIFGFLFRVLTGWPCVWLLNEKKKHSTLPPLSSLPIPHGIYKIHK